jgi:hypothetical protein
MQGSKLVASVTAVTLVVPLVLVGVAGAAPIDKICRVVDNLLICTTDFSDAGGTSEQPGSGGAEATPAGSPTAVWTSELLLLSPNPDLNPDPRVPGACVADDGEPGFVYRQTLRSVDTGEVLRVTFGCVAEGDPAAPPEAPPPPPAPPTVEEIVAATPIPAPEITVNPSGRGLTGLESWLWASNPSTVGTSVSLRGWTVTGSLSIGGWVWETGDGGHYQTDGPGTPQAPAVRHVYETKGTWPVSLEVSWSGSYTVSGYGASYSVGGLSVGGSDTLDYHVIEVRGVIDDDRT